jgi:hypothetical protein
MSNERVENISVDPDLAKDPNYIAYKGIEELLKESYLGQWVAFTGGEIVLVEPDKTSLFEKIDQQFPGKSVFVKEIVEEDPV